jgi:hypothetical protein
MTSEAVLKGKVSLPFMAHGTLWNIVGALGSMTDVAVLKGWDRPLYIGMG